MFVQSEIRLLLAIFPRLIYFSTRTMNLESDFKLRAVKLSREAVYSGSSRDFFEASCRCYLRQGLQHDYYLLIVATSTPHAAPLTKVGLVVRSIIAGGKKPLGGVHRHVVCELPLRTDLQTCICGCHRPRTIGSQQVLIGRKYFCRMLSPIYCLFCSGCSI